jgi:RHS repeat-associated protein
LHYKLMRLTEAITDNSTEPPPREYIVDVVGDLPMILMEINSSGGVVKYCTFEPFGRTIESGGTFSDPFGFTGQYLDAETGEYHLRARQYNPTLARFTARDPVFGDLQQPLTLHKYLYCGNNPLNYIDLSGLRAYYLTGGFGAMLGLGVNNQVGITWDDEGNKGIFVAQGVGGAFPITAGVKAGVQFGFMFDKESKIMDLAGNIQSAGIDIGPFAGEYWWDEKGQAGMEFGIGAGLEVKWPDWPSAHGYRTSIAVLPFQCTTLTFEEIMGVAAEESWNASQTWGDYYATLMWMGMTDTDFDFLFD